MCAAHTILSFIGSLVFITRCHKRKSVREREKRAAFYLYSAPKGRSAGRRRGKVTWIARIVTRFRV